MKAQIILFFLGIILSLYANDSTITMFMDNSYNAGYLVVREQDSTWKNWNSSQYLITQDDTGNIFPFSPDFPNNVIEPNYPVVRRTASPWFTFAGGSSPSLMQKGLSKGKQKVPHSKLNNECIGETQEFGDTREGELNGKSKDKKPKKDNRIRAVEKVVPE